MNDDLELVTACHDACNRYGLDAVSSSATIAWLCEAVEKGLISPAELDGIDMRWGNGEGALALTIKMGKGEGCGVWLRDGLALGDVLRADVDHVGAPFRVDVRRPRRPPGACARSRASRGVS